MRLGRGRDDPDHRRLRDHPGPGAAIEFYTGPLGLALDHRMEGFADFRGMGIALAVWQADTCGRTRACRAGVRFTTPPADYPWNSRCAYFTGPDQELWELYPWNPGGEPGAVG